MPCGVRPLRNNICRFDRWGIQGLLKKRPRMLKSATFDLRHRVAHWDKNVNVSRTVGWSIRIPESDVNPIASLDLRRINAGAYCDFHLLKYVTFSTNTESIPEAYYPGRKTEREREKWQKETAPARPASVHSGGGYCYHSMLAKLS